MSRRKFKDVSESAVSDNPPQFASEAFEFDFVRGHRVEQEVQRELMSEPACRFASLVVRRLDNGGVCLQGVMEADEQVPDVCAIAQRVAGVEQVLNHLLITPRREVPMKG